MQQIREWLDTALVHTADIEVGGLSTPDVRRSLEKALGAVYYAIDAKMDAAMVQAHCADAVDASREALEQLQAVPTDDEPTHAAMAAAAAAMGALLRRDYAATATIVLPRGDSPERPQASMGEPTLIELRRPIVPPAISLSTAPPAAAEVGTGPIIEPAPITTMEALEARMQETLAKLAALDAAAAAEEEPAPPPPPTEPEGTLDEHLAHACEENVGRMVARSEQVDVYSDYLFEDLGMLGLMRRHRDGNGQTWLGRAKPERRLLAKLDALIACGIERVPRLVRRLDYRPLPDPELTWALTFLCGCVSGEDAGDQMARIARTADLSSPEMRESLADALAIAPNPGAVALLERWLDEPSVEERSIALEALGRRRLLPPERIDAAIETDHPMLVEPAVRAMGRTDLPVREGTWLRALESNDPRIVEATFQAGLLRRKRIVLDRAGELCEAGRPEHGGAVLYAVLGSDEARARRALERALHTSSALIALEAAGHFGDISQVPLLLSCVANEHAAPTAVEALNRIFGADLQEGGEVAAEYEENERPFDRDFQPREEMILSLDPKLWTSWWRAHGEPARAGIRYRRGHRWSMRDALYELEDPNASARARRLAHVELAARSGLGLRFDQDAFVSRQQRQIEGWRAMLTPSVVQRSLGTWTVME